MTQSSTILDRDMPGFQAAGGSGGSSRRIPLEEMEDQAATAPPVRDFRAAAPEAGFNTTHCRGEEGQPVGHGHSR